ncbi:MAG: putative AlkP superfamily phosphohydrolase/phosphomutase [Candidatus Paceibacteria bacterium]|jgi:predicted AlkP superfamily phosphohydrolase/phosphomutase
MSRRFQSVLIAGLVGGAGMLLMSLGSGVVGPAPTVAAPSDTEHPRLVVLGIDGMDPEILAEAIKLYPDRMQNFKRLVDEGGLHSLGTSVPPQSPVAWSNFITGRNPGGHGIYDFIHRDLATREGIPGNIVMEDADEVELWGEWKFPLGGSSDTNRTGESFWVTLAQHGVPADIWRMPANFPVEPAEGVSFPGMMTPALDSAYGLYKIYTSDPPVDKDPHDGKYVQVRETNGVIRTTIEGPPNSFKQGDPNESTELVFYVDHDSNAVAIEGNGQVIVLEPGEWSDFITLEWELLPMGAMNMTGVVRFYLRSIEPEFELYASPVNIDPVSPISPVSEPSSASAELVDAIGMYYTQGMAEEVNALKGGALDDKEFMQQTKLVYDQRVKMMDYALDQYMGKDGGLFFFYYSTVDLNCHMMWRFHDGDHPQYKDIAELAEQDSSEWSGREGSQWKDVVYDLYLLMDPVLGKLRERVGDDTRVIVMSDHGFAPWRRKFSLNRWLHDEGYLVFRDGFGPELAREDPNYKQVSMAAAHGNSSPVDWSKTRAYGMGFNGLYLNLAGRERDVPETPEDESGIVKPGAEADALLVEIKAKLEAYRDTDGTQVVFVADLAKDVYQGERMAEAPDMQVGYNAGYGNSDASSLGRIPSYVIADNEGGTFNGNHLMAPEVVAGILLTNGEVLSGAHALEDLTIEIFKHYGIQPGKGQNGHPVLK